MKKALLLLLWPLLLGSVAFARAVQPPTATADSLEAYVGTFKFKDGSPLGQYVIRFKDGALFAEADSYGSNKLLKQPAADTFQSTSSYGSIIVFRRDANKKVVGLTLSIQGTDLEADRQ